MKTLLSALGLCLMFWVFAVLVMLTSCTMVYDVLPETTTGITYQHSAPDVVGTHIARTFAVMHGQVLSQRDGVIEGIVPGEHVRIQLEPLGPGTHVTIHSKGDSVGLDQRMSRMTFEQTLLSVSNN